MERMSESGHADYGELSRTIPRLDPQIVESLIGAGSTQHVLYLLDGQYLYAQRAEDGSLSYKFLSAHSVRLAFSQEGVDSGWLPPLVRRWGYGPVGQWAVMFVPPARHTLWLPSQVVRERGTGTETETETETETGEGAEVVWPHPALDPELTEPPGREQAIGRKVERELLVAVEVGLPGLVFVGVGQTYYLWASKEAEFLPQAQAYHAPLPNVYPDGRICWGGNRVEPVTPQNIVESWQLFIASPFNFDLAGGKSRRYPQNVVQGLGQLAAISLKSKRKRRSYPLRDLLPLSTNREREGATIGGLVERLIRGR